MENSVNQPGTGSTKIYKVTFTHEHSDHSYSPIEWTHTYTKYFNSKEEAEEFANEDNLISTHKEWAEYDHYSGWNGETIAEEEEDVDCGTEVRDTIHDLKVSEVKIGELSRYVAYELC